MGLPRADDPGGSGSPARQTITRIADWSDSAAAGTGTVSLAVSPVNVGDLLLASIAVYNGQSAIGISGGGVTTWNLVTSGSEIGTQETVTQWQGVVTAAGPSTILITLTNPAATITMATELNTPIAVPKWYVYGSTWKGCFSNSTYGYTTCALTPQSSDEMYLAFVATGTGGLSLPGFGLLGGTLVLNTGIYANTAGVATMPGVAYPTNYEYGVNGTGNTTYDEIACLIYATI